MLRNALANLQIEPGNDAAIQNSVDRQAWYEQRRDLERGQYRATPDGLIGLRRLGPLNASLKLFEQLLRLSGLHRRGRANALDIALKPVMVTLPNLPAAFDGYRILQISDPHLDLLPELADRIAAVLDGVSVDLLLTTGDYRDRHDDPPEPGLALLRHALSTVDVRDGRFALLGNHDPAAAVPLLEDMGLEVLLNQTVTIERQRSTLHVTGLDDVHHFYTAAAQAALQAPSNGCRIAAVHSPEVADLAADAGIDLYLCGHTHGGQIRLPGLPPIKTQLRRCRAYSHGLWRHGDMVGYTTNGTGVTTIPIRFNCPPEVALIILRRPA